MADWKIGDHFYLTGKKYVILAINKRKKTVDIGEPYTTAFGKEMVISRKTIHIREMINARK